MSGVSDERLAAARDLVELEAILLDEQRWDEWLELFTPDCVFWAPSWTTDDTLTADPETELSYIYYVDRAALEDRIIRVTSTLSPASTPVPRTTHILSGFRPLGELADDGVELRSSWACHVFWPQKKQAHTFFGRYAHELHWQNEGWVIARKTIVLQNDYIPSMIDFYCI